MTRAAPSDTNIYDLQGRRKYLTAGERGRFRECAAKLKPMERCFCFLFYYTGLRISEALEVSCTRVDASEGVVRIRTLKRRKDGVFRTVPLPRSYVRELTLAAANLSAEEPLWPFSRKTGYRLIKTVMKEAKISGVHACPKGLRHGFGIACVQKNIPLPTIAKWMGHSSINTTAIYLNAVGHEERLFAKRIW